MKKQLISTLLLLGLTASLNASNPITKEEAKVTKKVDKTLTIDLDKESIPKETKGSYDKFIDIPLEMIGGVNVLNFIGDILQQKLPLAITIGDNDEVTFKKGNSFTIDNNKLKIKLKDGDYIRMKDKDGKLFFQGEVMTH